MDSNSILLLVNGEYIRLGLQKSITDLNFDVIIDQANSASFSLTSEHNKHKFIIADLAAVELLKVTGTLNSIETPIILLIPTSVKVSLPKLLFYGVKGLINFEGDGELLQKAFKIIEGGGIFLDPKINQEFQNEFVEPPVNLIFRENFDLQKILTSREWEVLKCIADEMTNKEIASALFISPRTVETHRRNLIQKLKVKNTVGLVKVFFLKQSKSEESTYKYG